MTKRASSILLSLILLAISFVLLLCFFIYKNSNSDFTQPVFSVQAKNIDMNVGDSRFNYFEISHSKAALNIKSENEDVVYADSEKIVGLKPGIATVSITASLENIVETISFTVKVYNDTYTLNILPIADCFFTNNTLFVYENSCQFCLELQDKLGQPVNNTIFDLYSSVASIEKQFGQFSLICEKNGIVEVIADNQFYFALRIYCIQNKAARI